MPRIARPPRPWARPIRIILAALAVVSGLLILPECAWLLPDPVRRHSAACSLLGVAILIEVGRRRIRSEPWARVIPTLDRVSGVFLRGICPGLFLAACLALLATWAPHYLTWPWHRDADTFAMLARSWDDGVLPYRDVRAYNFPGHIYLHWLIGKVAGWTCTPALYGADVGLVVGFGVLLGAWSRKRFGTVVPGLVSCLAFLSFYLDLEYESVAERDEHTAILITSAIFAAEGWPGRRGWIGSAILASVALAIRPHAILFFPAILLAVASGAKGRGRPVIVALATWVSALAIGTLIAFGPILVAGVADDLIAGLRVASYGGPYSRRGSAGFLGDLWKEVQDEKVASLILGTTLLGLLAKGRAADSARVWAVALLGAVFYRPIHPVRHPYLFLPVAILTATSLAVPLGWFLSSPRFSASIRLLALSGFLIEFLPGIPKHCLPDRCIPALRSLLEGKYPSEEPSGCVPWFDVGTGRPYPWPEYVAVLKYLRERTGPATFVADVLKKAPFPAINGPAGRPSPFRAESGICWMWLIDLDLDADFAGQLDRAEDSVVVWAPGEVGEQPRLRLPRLTDLILRKYRFEARFGRIEVWRRNGVPENPEAGSLRGR